MDMLDRPAIAIVAVAALAAAIVWGPSAPRLPRAERRIEAATGVGSEAAQLARAGFLKDLHATVLYVVVMIVAAVEAGWDTRWADYLLFAPVVPAVLSLRYGKTLLRHARLAESRSQLEQRA